MTAEQQSLIKDEGYWGKEEKDWTLIKLDCWICGGSTLVCPYF